METPEMVGNMFKIINMSTRMLLLVTVLIFSLEDVDVSIVNMGPFYTLL